MKLIYLTLLLISFNCFALELQSGDVLLISFNCYECRVIESETNSSFSHSGVVIASSDKGIAVAQSLGRVGLFSLDNFKKNITPGTNVSVFRPIQFLNYSTEELKSLSRSMMDEFKTNFEGLTFDTKYLWNNFDSNGRELLYCSEFVAKFLDNFLTQKTIPYKLTFQKNSKYWFVYFHGVVPEGELGNSPSSFSRDTRFKFVGTL